MKKGFETYRYFYFPFCFFFFSVKLVPHFDVINKNQISFTHKQTAIFVEYRAKGYDFTRSKQLSDPQNCAVKV
jgi:hypothetical protein